MASVTFGEQRFFNISPASLYLVLHSPWCLVIFPMPRENLMTSCMYRYSWSSILCDNIIEPSKHLSIANRGYLPHTVFLGISISSIDDYYAHLSYCELSLKTDVLYLLNYSSIYNFVYACTGATEPLNHCCVRKYSCATYLAQYKCMFDCSTRQLPTPSHPIHPSPHPRPNITSGIENTFHSITRHFIPLFSFLPVLIQGQI